MKNKQRNGIHSPSGQFLSFAEMKRSESKEIATRQNSDEFDLTEGEPLPNPDPVLRKMGETITVYRDLLSDPKVEAVINSRRAGLTAMNYELDRGIDTTTPNIDFYKECLDRLDIKKILKNGFEGIEMGYGPAEITWETEKEGSNIYIRPTAVTSKPPEWFVFDIDNNLRFLSEDGDDEGELVPPMKFLVFNNDANYANPYGCGILSRVFWPVTFKKNGWRFWMTFLEKYGMPWAVGFHPRNAKTEEINTLLSSLSNMVQDAVAAIPDDNSIELKDSPFKGSSNIGYEKVHDKCNSEISLAIVGQTLTSELSGGTGSYSAGTVHASVKDEIVDADKETFESQINLLLRWVAYYNFDDMNDAPVFSLHREEDIQKEKAERDKTLTENLKENGLTLSAAYYQKTYGLAEEDITEITKEESSEGSFSEGNRKTLNFNSAEEEEKELNDLITATRSIPDYNDQFNKMIDPVVTAIANSKDFNEVQEILNTSFPNMNSDQLSESLSKAIFIAQGLGIVDSQEG